MGQVNQPPISRFNLKKVIARDGVFICGVCRVQHKKRVDANKCLERCASQLEANTRVVEQFETPKGTAYRCGICRRNFRKLANAQKCLQECASKQKSQQTKALKLKAADPTLRAVGETAGQFVKSKNNLSKKPTLKTKKKLSKVDSAEDQFDGLPDDDLDMSIEGNSSSSASAASRARSRGGRDSDIDLAGFDDGLEDDFGGGGARRSKNRKSDRRDQMYKYRRDGRILYCAKCGSEFKTLDDVIDCYDSHPEKEKSSSEDNRHKFDRDGAKYVCKLCQSKYFTQTEVVDCYDSHDGQKVVKKPDTSDELASSGDDGGEPDWGEALGEQASGGAGGADEDGHKYERDGAKYVCGNCKSKFFTKAEVVACFDGHSGSTSGSADEELEDDGEIDWGAAMGEQTGANIDGGDEGKYQRDGAKYVCIKCGNKFFTKSEVVKCHDGH